MIEVFIFRIVLGLITIYFSCIINNCLFTIWVW
uniref:Cytochrome b6/f complex subunit V n=1 Tax=Aphyllon epigalium subsp. epigalium TaxID=2249432 RepID=A0A386AWF9_9LAMI|nr:cytochrome b6/f complex subunit V [Aphyllon epigalium subsp. epigalium]